MWIARIIGIVDKFNPSPYWNSCKLNRPITVQLFNCNWMKKTIRKNLKEVLVYFFNGKVTVLLQDKWIDWHLEQTGQLLRSGLVCKVGSKSFRLMDCNGT